jgi:hypothetical protein
MSTEKAEASEATTGSGTHSETPSSQRIPYAQIVKLKAGFVRLKRFITRSRYPLIRASNSTQTTASHCASNATADERQEANE